MKLDQLSLANYRGFEQLDLSFEPDVTLIAGVNGVGKSSVLSAIATVLSRAMPEFTPSRSTPIYFSDDDIHEDKTSLEVSLRVDVDEQVLDAGIQRVRDAEGESDRFILLRRDRSATKVNNFADALRVRILTGEIEAGLKETRSVLQSLKMQASPPLAIYFTPKRQLPGRPRSLPVPKPFEVSQAYGRALHDRDVELREFMHWFRTQEALAQEGDNARCRVLDTLRQVVNEFVPEFTDLRIQEAPKLGLVVEKEGKLLYLHQLSDGERGLLALVFDLTRRLAIANPELDDPLTDGSAVVMIDEIELHLHPRWQREVLGRLMFVFPNCQFIVTTHSPMVLGEAKARCIRFLEYQDGKVIATTPQEAYGMDANRVLQELMGSPVRNQKIEQKLQELFKVLDDEEFDKARAMIRELSEPLGQHDPELTRASSLIHFLEGDE